MERLEADIDKLEELIAETTDKNWDSQATAVIQMLKSYGIENWKENLLGSLVMEIFTEVTVNENTAANANASISDLEKIYKLNAEIFFAILDNHPDFWQDIHLGSKSLRRLVPKDYRKVIGVNLIVK